MRLRQLLLGCLLLFWLCVGLVGCVALPKAIESDRIVVGTAARLRTLDPADAYELLSGALLYALGDRLYTTRPDSVEIVPQLATALPEISPDGLTYRIPLRQDVRFHDGSPFNAAAMAFSLQRFIKNGGRPSYLLGDRVASIQATGDYELTIQLKAPFAPFLALLTFPGLCAVSPQAYQPAAGQFLPQQFVGTGPYRLESFQGDRLRLAANRDYWGEKPRNEGLDIQIFSSPSNLYSALGTGLVDVTYQGLDAEQIRGLRQQAAEGRIQINNNDGLGIYYLTVNVLSPPLDRPEVRQALALAINRDVIRDRVFYGQVQPLYSLVPSEFPVSEPDFPRNNPEQARAVLTAAGYSSSKPLKLDLWYRSNLNSNVLAASTLRASVQQQLDGLIDLQLQGVESTTAYENLEKGAYPLFLLDWLPDFLDADNYLQPFLACSQGNPQQGCQSGSSYYQGSFYYSDRANQLLQQAGESTDPQARDRLLRELQQLSAEDLPFIPLWQNREYLFSQPYIQGGNIRASGAIAFGQLRKVKNVAR